MHEKFRRRGRRPGERLTAEQIRSIKAQIIADFGSLIGFYESALSEAKSPQYKDQEPPRKLETLRRAFTAAFSEDEQERRALPLVYRNLLKNLIRIDVLNSVSALFEDKATRLSSLGQKTDNSSRKDDVDFSNKLGSAKSVSESSTNISEIVKAVDLPTEPQRIPPNNLPRLERDVIGRAQEVETLLQVLAKTNRTWLISITGVGGVGKTALALEVAHRCITLTKLPDKLDGGDLYFDAVVWTSAKQKELEGPSVRLRLSIKCNLASIVREILKVVAPEKIGASPSEEKQREMAVDLLKTRRILLIVDNMEAIDDEQVLAFLREIPVPSKVIITDRRAIHESRSLPLAELPLADAINLIKEQCNSEFFHNRLNLNEDQIAKLARKTGGIPLAIIWALGRIAATGSDPDAVIRRLADAGASPVLDFLFTESYDLISDNSRIMLAALALPGTPVMGEILSEWLNLGRNDVEDAIDQLREFALITEHRSTGSPNTEGIRPTIQRSYRLHTLAREYVRNRGIPLDEKTRQLIGDKLLGFVARREQNHDWPSIETIDIIDENHELLVWGVEDAFNNARHQVVVEMVRRLSYALGIRGYNDLRLRLADMAAHSARTIGSPLEFARILITGKAWIHFFWADYDKCLGALNDSASALEECDDRVLKAVALRLTAQVAKEQKQLSKSKKLLAASLKMLKEIDDPYQLCITHGTWGSLHRDLADYAEAERSMREALQIALGLKNSEELRTVMCQKLTKLMIEMNRLSEADEFNMQAEAILVQLRRQVGVAYCKLNRARIAERRNEFDKALNFAKEAELLFVQYGDRREIALDLQRIQEKASKVR